MIPTQLRAVDPFSSYESDNVNRITRILTSGNDKIVRNDHLAGTKYSDSQIKITKGLCVKDDVVLHMSADEYLDITDTTNYIDGTFLDLDVPTDAYLVMYYEYVKNVVPNEGKYMILEEKRIFHINEPSYYNSNSAYLFLARVTFVTDGALSTGYRISEVFPLDDTVSPNITRQIANLSDTYTDENARTAQLEASIIDHRAEPTKLNKVISTDPTTGSISFIDNAKVGRGEILLLAANYLTHSGPEGDKYIDVTHNYGVKPTIQLLKTSSGEMVLPSEIIHQTNNTVRLIFDFGVDTPYDMTMVV